MQSLLAAYAAGTLAEADAERVRAHLASGCLQCLTSVFARPVGLPRDLPLTHAPPPTEPPPPETPPRRAPWRGILVGVGFVAGMAGAALVLGRDAQQDRPTPPPVREPITTAARVPPQPTRRVGGWDDETPIIHAREDETTTSTTEQPAETPTSTLPSADTAAPDTPFPQELAALPSDDDAAPEEVPPPAAVALPEQAPLTETDGGSAEEAPLAEPEGDDGEPVEEAPSNDDAVAAVPRPSQSGLATSTPSTAGAARAGATASPPATDDPRVIPTIPPAEIEKARLRALLEAERSELDERTRELEDANDRARAAEAESVEQAAAVAALEAQLQAAKRRVDELDRKQLMAPLRSRRPESTAAESMLAAPDARLMPLRPVGMFQDVRGHVVWRPGSGGVVVYGFGLPRLPHERTYNVRVDVGGGEAVTIPKLRPDERGRMIVPVRLPSGAHAVTGVRIARDLDGDAVLASGPPTSTVR